MKKVSWKTLLVHAIVFVSYSVIILNFSGLLTGHDDYNLGEIGLFLICIICHTFVGVIYNMSNIFKQIKSNHQILNEL